MTTKAIRPKKKCRNKINLYLDILLAILFILEMEVQFTGVSLHELIGILFTVLLGIHIFLHWQWIKKLTQTLFKRVLHESRVNYLLNWLLLVVTVVATLSGFIIAQTLGYTLGFSAAFMSTALFVHVVSVQLCLLLTALHIAMHWKWIVTNVKKYILNRRTAKQSAPKRSKPPQTPVLTAAVLRPKPDAEVQS